MLSDLIDFGTPAWKDNQFIVNDGSADIIATAPAPWWENPLVVDNNGIAAAEAVSGTIYLVTADPTALHVIDVPKVRLVIQPGVTVTGTAAGSENVVTGSSTNFLWVEGEVDATGDTIGFFFTSVKFSVMRGVNAKNSGGQGVRLSFSSNSFLKDIHSSKNSGHGVHFLASQDLTLSRLTTVHNSLSGVYVQTTHNSEITSVSASNNGGYGVNVINAVNNKMAGITGGNNGGGLFCLTRVQPAPSSPTLPQPTVGIPALKST